MLKSNSSEVTGYIDGDGEILQKKWIGSGIGVGVVERAWGLCLVKPGGK